MHKTIHGTFIPFSQNICISLQGALINLNHHPPNSEQPRDMGGGGLSRVSFGLCSVHFEVYEDALKEHNST